jgi:hypothetical protein
LAFFLFAFLLEELHRFALLFFLLTSACFSRSVGLAFLFTGFGFDLGFETGGFGFDLPLRAGV